MARRGNQVDHELIFNVDNARSRDAIRWTHSRIIERHPTFFQGFFLNATRVGDTNHVQMYTEDRQLRILGYRLQRDPNICNLLYRDGMRVVTERPEDAGREIEIYNMAGTLVSTIQHVFDFPDDAFQTSLVTELMIEDIFCIEIINEQGPNTVIMTLAMDYPPIY